MPAGQGHSPRWLHGQANAGPQAPPDGAATAQDATTSMRCRPLSLSRPLLAPPRDHLRERRAPPRQPVPSDLSGAPLHRLPTAPAHPARATTHRRHPTQPSRPGRRPARHRNRRQCKRRSKLETPVPSSLHRENLRRRQVVARVIHSPRLRSKDADLRQRSGMSPELVAPMGQCSAMHPELGTAPSPLSCGR